MQSGMEMMLKSMGIDTAAIKELLDPEKIKLLLLRIEKTIDQVDCMQPTLAAIEETLMVLEEKLVRLEIKHGTIPYDDAMQLLADNKESAEKETADYVRNNSDGSGNN
jgi:hypothetical protein